MPVSISGFGLEYHYQLISLWQCDAEMFLSSTQPEEVILGILADFKGKKPDEIIRTILNRLKELTAKQSGYEKYEIQLRVLSQLRKLQVQINKEI